MKQENQVACKELSIKLKKFGFKQESIYHWQKGIGDASLRINHNALHDLNVRAFSQIETSDFKEWYHAYTVAELGEMLPVEYYSLKAYNGDWYCYKVLEEEDLLFTFTRSKTEADSRAKMLIYLKGNNLI